MPQSNSHSLVSSPVTAENSSNHKKGNLPAFVCASRTIGQQSDAGDQRPLTEVTMSLLNKAGFEVILRRS
ncbi:hypothetical protein O9929_14705 [Vibrio lentus]|nr:hypothetical protein [Vibrio lentus]